jgi:esterase/lipase superfamily enzyme
MEIQRVDWRSPSLGATLRVVRWGHGGAPLVLFPTAGGDAEECERMLMIRVLTPMIEAGRLRVWSVDHVAGWAWIDDGVHPRRKVSTQQRYNRFLAEELFPLVRAQSGGALPIVAGYSLGGYQSFAAVCRNPHQVRGAICMSSAYDLSPLVEGHHDEDFHYTSPVHFLPDLQDESLLAPLRERFVLMVHGRGRVEKPWRAWPIAEMLGRKGVPNRVDVWSEDHDHDWMAWREQLPQYLERLAP